MKKTKKVAEYRVPVASGQTILTRKCTQRQGFFSPRKICRLFFGLLLLGPVLVSKGLAATLFPQAGLATQHPWATAAGLEVLRAGGNAMDAAYASVVVLGVVEPFNSGLGGGGFLIQYSADRRQVAALNFRERAPQAIRWQDFKPGESRVGWKAVGVPGTLAGLEESRRRWGQWPRQRLLQAGIDLAERGFVVDVELAKRIGLRRKDLESDPDLKKIFFRDGHPLRAGDLLVQKDLAKTLRGIARQGEKYFYRGLVAKSAVQGSRNGGGFLQASDFSQMRSQPLAVLHGVYRAYDVYSIDLPSSGGLVLFETLNVWRALEPNLQERWSSKNIRLLAKAMASAFTDRAQMLGDPRFAKMPREHFMSQSLAKERAAALLSKQNKPSQRKPEPPEGDQTTHLVAVDTHGNAVSLTNSLNTSFGAAVAIPGTGIILNNTIDDFSFPDQGENAYGLTGNAANWPGPGKYPLSSMTPTLVMQADQLRAVLGSPGGPRIISSVLLTLINIFDFEMPLDQALAQRRFHQQSTNGPLFLEMGATDKSQSLQLRQKGIEVKRESPWGNVQILLHTPEGWRGASDPRGRGMSAGF